MINGHDHPMIVADMMKKIIPYFISLLSWITAIINSTHIISICDGMMNIIQLDQMIITMQVNGASGTIEYFIITDNVTNTFNVDAGFIRTFQPVKIMNTAVQYLVITIFKC